jgi:2-(1,2-epoxy-1,2-dihydrophenyl)acetyl-CoA isomerase
MKEATDLAGKLSVMPTRALGLTKRLLNRSITNTLSEQLDFERDVQEEAGQTEDFREGVAAFLGKRPPVYKGM